MNLVAFALGRPITIVVLVIATVLMGILATLRMPRDIFPNLGIPVLYIAQPYGGMDPAQMEGYLVKTIGISDPKRTLPDGLMILPFTIA
ncbi:MAG: efflux RND transporter permease subunit [Methylocystis sp.]|uniref:efflux RND transporter permease subunit n=1 Tax=Methylocystis sp. TaxID=1911079 RepID=UPI003DA59F43